MLKASGIWVSPAEVENRLLAHQSVAQAVVVAAPDTDGLEKPVAYVVLQAGGTVTEAELIEFSRQGMPSFKRPRKIIFVDRYPMTATGKIRRADLRAMAATALLPPLPGAERTGQAVPAEHAGPTAGLRESLSPSAGEAARIRAPATAVVTPPAGTR
jgi:acyl-CoA synthetase (AMP-forming)/AMP-acid ligase II